jgi:hypothetical protein
VLAIHLANRFIVALSRARVGYALTPPILYTRYDHRTGGYVQAFPYVEGRPLRPWRPGLPLLGEARWALPVMRRWRDFLAEELGFWGLARQVDPANPNSFSNIWITPEKHVLLLDMVPGLPGFLEPRYLWWGLVRGDFPPFGDAVDLDRLSRSVDESGPGADTAGARDLELLRLALQQWRASEPRLLSSPARPFSLWRDKGVRRGTRSALLRHLEVKGAATPLEVKQYRVMLAATGTFPRRGRHAVLKMAPLAIHRALTNAAYAQRLIRQGWRVPLKVARTAAGWMERLAGRVGLYAAAMWRLLRDRRERVERCRAVLHGWMANDEAVGRLSSKEAAALRKKLGRDGEVSDLAGLFAVHLTVSALKQSIVGPSGVWIALAIATGNWWWAVPAGIAPALRIAAALWLGLGRRLGLLALCALPAVGVLAAPIHLLRREPELGGFMVRSLAARAALRIPGFGARGAFTEILAVAATQILFVDPARMLPFVLAGVAVGVVQDVAWLSWLSLGVYLVAVAGSVFRLRRASSEQAEAQGWRLGVPESPA